MFDRSLLMQRAAPVRGSTPSVGARAAKPARHITGQIVGLDGGVSPA